MIMKISLDPAGFWDLALSHHPDLPCFDDDVVILYGKRICAGCLFAYPTALLVLFFFRPSGYESIIISILFASFSMSRKLIRNRYINFFFRLVAGVALGFGVGGLIWAIQNHQVFAMVIIASGGCIYGIIRFFSMKRKIKDWEKSNY
jgi:hypothetical protein